MSIRSRARQAALQTLYWEDLNPDVDPAVIAQFLRKELKRNALSIDFATVLRDGVRTHREVLDAVLTDKAQRWSVNRMTPVDRNILRLGAYEILYTDTPAPVVINEAIELAKAFGDQKSSSFVNGILDRVMREQPPASLPSKD